MEYDEDEKKGDLDSGLTPRPVETKAPVEPEIAAESKLSRAVPGATAGRVLASVPRLDDLIIKALAENYEVYPAFDRIPPEYLDHVIALLDPSKIEFANAAKFIRTEKFWKRLCRERWPINQLQAHGLSYKRMYVERHLESLLEGFHPSRSSDNMDRLMREVEASKPCVHALRIQQLPSHLDLSIVLGTFPNLALLELKYGARKLGMDYEKAAFGMQLTDAMYLAKMVAKTRTLNRLVLSENLLTDESVHVLMSGLGKNDTITYLDLSHNKIGDTGVRRLCQLLDAQSVLTSLNLEDNAIRAEGAAALGQAISHNTVLQELNLRLNNLGDEGGAALLAGVRESTSLTALDVGGCELKTQSGKHLEALIRQTATLVHLEVSCNELAGPAGGKYLAEALELNKSLLTLDLRKTGASEETTKTVHTLLSKRQASDKRSRRHALQSGWDDVM